MQEMRVYLLNNTKPYHDENDGYSGDWFNCPVDFGEVKEKLGVEHEEQIEIADYELVHTLQRTRHVAAQRHAHARHFERVSEAVVNEDAAWQRKHLCLVLHTTERSREDKAVVVAFELRTVVVTFGVAQLLSESLVRYELLPIHCHNRFVLFIAQN